jgi:hypothetical protein
VVRGRSAVAQNDTNTRRDVACGHSGEPVARPSKRSANMSDNSTNPRGGSNPWNLVLAVPFVALLWVPFYNSIEPTLWGVPFFYWYQFLWVFITSVVILWVYRRSDARRSRN